MTVGYYEERNIYKPWALKMIGDVLSEDPEASRKHSELLYITHHAGVEQAAIFPAWGAANASSFKE